MLEDGAFDALDAADAESLAEEVRQLRTALYRRLVIGQASGLLMAWFDLDPESAFQYMRRRSMDENRKLYDVAAELVRTRRRPRRPT